MGSPGRSHEAHDLRARARPTSSGRRDRRGVAGQPSCRLPAPEVAEDGRPRPRPRRGDQADLPGQPGRVARAARAAGTVLDRGARQLQAARGTTRGGHMTTQAQDTSVRTEIVVNAPTERAFTLFTERFDRIKPREHNMLGVDIAESV